MQKLHLVGFTTDREGLILSTRRGARSGSYVVPIDGALEAAIDELRASRGDEPEGEDAPRTARVESSLSVKEIQARLRHGRSVAEVAKAAGVDAEWVERFAPPVLAERAQVVARVRAVPLHRPRLGASRLPIGEAVRHHLADRGVALTDDEFAEAWTAHQLSEGRWSVRFAYRYRGKLRTLQYDLDESTGEVGVADRTSAQLGYVAPLEVAGTGPTRSASGSDGRPVAPRPVVQTGYRATPADHPPTSRSAREREKATAAMGKAAAQRAAEAERAAARKAKEREEHLAREAKAAERERARQAREAEQARLRQAREERAATAAAKAAAVAREREAKAKAAAQAKAARERQAKARAAAQARARAKATAKAAAQAKAKAATQAKATAAPGKRTPTAKAAKVGSGRAKAAPAKAPGAPSKAPVKPTPVPAKAAAAPTTAKAAVVTAAVPARGASPATPPVARASSTPRPGPSTVPPATPRLVASSSTSPTRPGPPPRPALGAPGSLPARPRPAAPARDAAPAVAPRPSAPERPARPAPASVWVPPGEPVRRPQFRTGLVEQADAERRASERGTVQPPAPATGRTPASSNGASGAAPRPRRTRPLRAT